MAEQFSTIETFRTPAGEIERLHEKAIDLSGRSLVPAFTRDGAVQRARWSIGEQFGELTIPETAVQGEGYIELP